MLALHLYPSNYFDFQLPRCRLGSGSGGLLVVQYDVGCDALLASQPARPSEAPDFAERDSRRIGVVHQQPHLPGPLARRVEPDQVRERTQCPRARQELQEVLEAATAPRRPRTGSGTATTSRRASPLTPRIADDSPRAEPRAQVARHVQPAADELPHLDRLAGNSPTAAPRGRRRTGMRTRTAPPGTAWRNPAPSRVPAPTRRTVRAAHRGSVAKSSSSGRAWLATGSDSAQAR